MEVTPFAAYRFGGSLSVEEGKLQLDASPAFGVSLDYETRHRTRVQVLYSQQRTGLVLRDRSAVSRDLFDVTVRYVQAGAMYGRTASWGWPYLVFTAGVSNFDPSRAGTDQEWGLAGSGGAGLIWPPTGSVAARLEGRIWVTSVRGPDALFCQSGLGCYVAVSGPLLWQGQLSAGLDVSF